MAYAKDMSNFKGKYFTVIKRVKNSKNKQAKWLCKCICGNKFIKEGYAIRNSPYISCGCKKKEVKLATMYKTARWGNEREYAIWNHMLRRCFNPKSKDFSNYGGRGIIVCKRWQNNFELFFKDMGKSPSKKHSIDRINTNGNYEPNNCRWATSKEQNNNRRNNYLVTHNNETKTLMEWSNLYKIPYQGLKYRIDKGETLQQILDKPSRSMGKKLFIKVNGKRTRLSDYCKIKGLQYDTIFHRIKSGWSIKEAVSTPIRKYKSL